MSETADQAAAQENSDQDPQRALDDMRRAIARAREQVRTFRNVLSRDDPDDA